MTRFLGLLTAVSIGFASVTPASAHPYHHHGGGPILGLVGAAVAVATLPVRIVGGAVSAITYPAPVRYAQPIYYAAPPAYPVYAPQPVYYSQPVHAQPQAYYPQPGYAYPQGAYGQ